MTLFLDCEELSRSHRAIVLQDTCDDGPFSRKGVASQEFQVFEVLIRRRDLAKACETAHFRVLCEDHRCYGRLNYEDLLSACLSNELLMQILE